MDPRDSIAALLTRPDPAFLPHLSVDCAVFGFHAGALKLLLLKSQYLDAWALPGGHVRRDEPVDAAAARILRERTGLERVFLQQFHTFGGVDRGEGAVMRALGAAVGVEVAADHWIAERVVSVGYLALVDAAAATPTPGAGFDECRWWDVRDRPRLLFDHDAISEGALETLRARARYLPLGASLLPEKFTMPELQRLYEAVHGHALDRRNFQKWVLDLGFVERLGERKTGGAHRAPYLYRFVAEPAAGGNAC